MAYATISSHSISQYTRLRHKAKSLLMMHNSSLPCLHHSNVQLERVRCHLVAVTQPSAEGLNEILPFRLEGCRQSTLTCKQVLVWFTLRQQQIIIITHDAHDCVGRGSIVNPTKPSSQSKVCSTCYYKKSFCQCRYTAGTHDQQGCA